MLIRRHNTAAAFHPSCGAAIMAVPFDQSAQAKGGREPQDGRYAAPILLEIERYLRQHRMSASRFGRLAASDPRLVSDLRKGRDPSSRTVARIRSYISQASARSAS
ncbi:hypothetical protein FHS54_001452 [Sphingobium vermicomposti]|uniref:Uncharacterized protein n=1 Tax=Sphingobium vermicomposti TaxID=529005 RepID=A0A846MGZ8_9SPHN|nr:hypothetical protein [Sphingobium vermicomposti]